MSSLILQIQTYQPKFASYLRTLSPSLFSPPLGHSIFPSAQFRPMSHTKSKNVTVPHGKIEFRILCSTTAAGGVIGRSGGVVKQLERETFTNICIDCAISSSFKERLIHVIGSSTVNRKFNFPDNEAAVSAAQEALLRVFERMVEVDPPEVVGGMVRCRLLVGPGIVGAVMGPGGQRIDKIIKQTGAYIKNFAPKELVLLCASPSDELIQISGNSLAVKKALLHVSCYIQQKTSQIVEGANVVAPGFRPRMKLETGNAAIDHRVNERDVAEVVFKLLCPGKAAGAVLGFRGTKVKALEEETGASIRFSAAMNDCNERIVTVSAFENRKSDHSAAQTALVRVFNFVMSSEQSEPDQIVTARFLVHSGCLNVLRDSITSCMPKATGATLQVLEQNCTLAGALTDEKVIQIDGEHSSVQITLIEVSWMLRKSYFDAISTKNNSPLFPHKLFNLSPHGNKKAVLTKKMENCRVSEEFKGSLPSKVQHYEINRGHCLSARTDYPSEPTTIDGIPEHGGSRTVIVTNTRMEISVRTDVFSSIFGDDGYNLSRLRMISGAKVEVQDHCPESGAKVFISGTPEQSLTAQSLLQAFIMAAQ